MKVKERLKNSSKYKRTEETWQLHSTCDPGLDPFAIIHYGNSWWNCLMNNHFIGVFCIDLRTFLEGWNYFKIKSPTSSHFMDEEVKTKCLPMSKS